MDSLVGEKSEPSSRESFVDMLHKGMLEDMKIKVKIACSVAICLAQLLRP